MTIQTVGNPENPAILFFHAMGVTGASSLPAAEYLKEQYYCILPTCTVYCRDQKYRSREDEVLQIENFLTEQGIRELALVTASSMGADPALVFLSRGKIPVSHVFFDGGQFVQIQKGLRRIMTPFLYLAIRSFYFTKGRSLKYILWCDDEAIRPYFTEAGGNLTFRNLYRQMMDSFITDPYPTLPPELQKNSFWEFGSIEDHYKYRKNVMKAYPCGHFPVFENYNHMQYQIRDPKGFAALLDTVIRENRLPALSFLRDDKKKNE